MPWKQDYTISDEIAIADSDVRWPDGNRCCLNIVVDLNPAARPDGITAKDLGYPVNHYGMNEGLDLMLALFARLGLKATFAVPGAVAAMHPERLRAIAGAGHEIAANGLLGEDPLTLPAETERERLALATGMIADVTGTPPAGWYALPRPGDAFATGNVSASTIDLLIAEGYAYFGTGHADDAPHYWISDFASRRSLLALPYYYHFDDRFFLMFPAEGTGLERPLVLLRNWQAEFRAQYRRGRYFSLTVSPARSGWGHRLANLDRFLSDAVTLPGLWNATGAEVAAHWSATFPADTHLRLEPPIWRSYEGSLD